MADGMANPYTVVAAVLQAARLGVVEQLSPPAAETGDGIESINTGRRCARNLGAALDDLEADTELVAAIGADLVANFIGIKRQEWATYIGSSPTSDDNTAAMTEWERNVYLPFH